MPLKREYIPLLDDDDDDDDLEKASTKQKKQKTTSCPRKERKPWTESEENQLRQAINNIVKRNLWNEVKTNPELVKRGADGVNNHWTAIYKKWRS
ncbi:uncharacterized protein IL334_003373 [Kwoniella shivajii]|uniref:Myb-like domain-containing protein n=1 Tax=Kwoniella shivajii TaxID=564305 RepID=A0ABZ1D1H5_9TREE|nr:hypothetical protein IL334_003373 [Kwoniella shivajii]